MANDTVYLNGQYMAKNNAKISPLDRGFLFGDGIYEVIPCLNSQLVGFELHIARLAQGLANIKIAHQWSIPQWRNMINSLVERNGGGNLSVYIQITRGTDASRQHGFPKQINNTVFAMCQALPSTFTINAADSRGLHVVTQPDQRWRNCHIKSTSLLANVMHYQHSQDLHKDETLLYNEQREITEASTSNVFVIKDTVIQTPPLDQQILPGITRAMVIDMLQRHNQMQIIEQPISLQDARQADEIWLTSSSKQISSVLTLDGELVGNGQIGPLCQIAQRIFDQHKFDY